MSDENNVPVTGARRGPRIERIRDIPSQLLWVDNGRDGRRIVRITRIDGQHRIEVGFDDGQKREVWLTAAYYGPQWPSDEQIIRGAYNRFGTQLALRHHLIPLTDI
jgi:hypothetical protein